jgi:hypothetical protein
LAGIGACDRAAIRPETTFVILTSLGYGDIVPMTAQARSLSILEPVSGIMYVAVLKPVISVSTPLGDLNWIPRPLASIRIQKG